MYTYRILGNAVLHLLNGIKTCRIQWLKDFLLSPCSTKVLFVVINNDKDNDYDNDNDDDDDDNDNLGQIWLFRGVFFVSKSILRIETKESLISIWKHQSHARILMY